MKPITIFSAETEINAKLDSGPRYGIHTLIEP